MRRLGLSLKKFQDRQVTTDDMVKVGPFIAYIASKTKDVI